MSHSSGSFKEMEHTDAGLETISQAPIFILSAERSGSTLCRYILDTHDDIGSPGELSLGELCASLLRVMIRVGTASDHPQDGPPSEVCLNIRRIIDGIMTMYVERVGKKVWCEKSPVNLRFLPIISHVFPDARYICLYRSFRDAAYSCISVSHFGFVPNMQEYVIKYPGNFVMAMAESWADKTERLIAFESQGSRQCIRVRYEDLVCDPDREMSRILEFLCLPWNSSILEAALLTHHDEGGGDCKIRSETAIHRRSIGSGKDLPLGMVARPLAARINRLLVILQYPPLYSQDPLV